MIRLLVEEALCLTFVGLILLGLTCPNTRHLLLPLLLPFLKGSMPRGRPSHQVYHLLIEPVVFLIVLQQPH